MTEELGWKGFLDPNQIELIYICDRHETTHFIAFITEKQRKSISESFEPNAEVFGISFLPICFEQLNNEKLQRATDFRNFLSQCQSLVDVEQLIIVLRYLCKFHSFPPELLEQFMTLVRTNIQFVRKGRTETQKVQIRTLDWEKDELPTEQNAKHPVRYYF